MARPAINNTAAYSVKGPQLLYWAPLSAIANIDAPNYASFAYLGTTVKAPEVSFENPHEPVMNSIGGTMVPTDKAYQGSSATIVCPINRYSESSLRALMCLPFYTGSNSSTAIDAQDAGGWAFQDIGALSQQDGAAFMLLIMNAFGGNAGATLNMPFGRRFLCCTFPEGKEMDATTIPNVESLVFEANMHRGPFISNGVFVNAKYRVWDYIDAAIPTLPLPS